MEGDRYKDLLLLDYLEYLLKVRSVNDAFVHEKYISRLLTSTADSSGRNRLKEFLKQSRSYSPSRVLALFPETGLFEERCILLGKMGQHEQALLLLVNEKQDFDLAER